MKHFKLMKGVLACLLSLVLVATSITPATGISAAETATTTTVVMPTEVSATYDHEKNTVTPAGKAVIYVVKKATGNDIKAGSKCFETSKAITLTDLGIKGTNKDVYLYVCNKQFEAAGKGISANLVIKAQAAKKVTVNVDYTKADTASATDVLSATAVDTKKAAIDKANISLVWSKDGTKYAASNTFTGEELAKMLKAGGGLIYVKMEGKSGSTGDAQFDCKAVKVKIAKPAKAPSMKMDVKKDTIALKNGFDFGIATKSGKNYEVTTWYTILPVLKTAGTKKAEDSIVPTSRFAPVSKKSTDANVENDGTNNVSYTAYKFKAVNFVEVLDVLGLGADEDFILAVRKSATEKKPASDVSYYKVSGQTLAPIVLTESKVDGQYLIASGKDFAKKGISLGSVIVYPGTSGSGQTLTLATTGFDKSFKVGKAGNKDADENGANFEYCIVKTENLFATENDSKIDFSTASWKKFDPAKAKFNAKTKSKYNTIGGTKVEAVLAATDKPETGFNEANIAADVTKIPEGTVILVRRAGVKGKTVEDAKRNSEYTILYVVKDENGTFEIYGRQDIGDKAWKYTVKFAKYNAEGDDGAGYYVDDSATLSQWIATGTQTGKTEIPKADKFEYSLAGDPNAKGKYEVTSNSGGLTTEGTKTYANIDSVATTNTDEQTKVYLIKEYANVTVTINYDTTDGVAKAADKITIKDGVSSVSGVNTKYFVGADASTAISYADIITANTGEGKKFDGYKIGDATMEAMTGVTLNKDAKTITYTGAVVPTSTNVDIEITIKLENVVVTFDAGDGSGTMADVKIAKDGKLTDAQLTCKFTAPDGKEFDCWKDKAGNTVTKDTVISTDTDLTAKWKDKT